MSADQVALPIGDPIGKHLTVLGVIDDGVVARNAPRGRGSEINDALARRLGGKLQRTFSSRGTVAILTFPRRQKAGEFALTRRRETHVEFQLA